MSCTDRDCGKATGPLDIPNILAAVKERDNDLRAHLDRNVGIKYDQGKPPLSILTKESLEAEAVALGYGANKYGKDNYKKGMDWCRVIDACMRHLVAFNSKEDIDSESGLSHLAHAKANLAILIYYVENNKGKDDR